MLTIYSEIVIRKEKIPLDFFSLMILHILKNAF